MKLNSLFVTCLATFNLAFIALPSEAAQIIVNDTIYDVTTVEGTLDSLSTQLTMQPWWGSRSEARTFAEELEDLLGFPNIAPEEEILLAPFFAYDSLHPSDQFVSFTAYNEFGNVALFNENRFATYIYAVAEEVPIPEPLAILGTFSVVGFLPLLKKQKQQSRNPNNLINHG